ncbi:MAG: hypothetical protein ABJV60_03790 [Lentilitoribacter sp.]
MSRFVAYIFMLCAFLAPAAVLFYEFSNNYIYASDALIRFLVSSAAWFKADFALVGEVTPAIAAIFVAKNAPKELSKPLMTVSLAVCVLGFALYLFLGFHIEDQPVFFERSMLDWIEASIEGHVDRNDFEGSVEQVGSVFSSVRIFYLVVACSIIGFQLNVAGSEKEQK